MKNLFDKWTIGINIVGIIFIKWILDNPFGFEQIINVALFFGVIYFLSFVHLFYFKGFMKKILMGAIDSFMVVIYLLIVSLDIHFLFALFVGYILPVIIIASLSYGLTFLWRKFRK